jgi:hypothetical protein
VHYKNWTLTNLYDLKTAICASGIRKYARQVKGKEHIPNREEINHLTPEAKTLLREWKRLEIGTDGILRRKRGPLMQLVLPHCYRMTVYKELHQNMGHLGAEREVELARERFFWPHMQRNITHFVTKECSCVKQRAPAKKTRAPLQNITTYAPLELVSMDFLHLERGTGGQGRIFIYLKGGGG